MDKAEKQQLITSLYTVFNAVKTRETSPYKLWPYVVGIACGMSKRLVVDEQYKDKPIVSLFSLSAYSNENDYNKQLGYYNIAISDIIDASNEVCSFNVDKVNEICYQTWAQRQSMVFPKALAINAKEGVDAVSCSIDSCINVTPTQEVMSLKENETVIISVSYLIGIIEDLVKKYQQEVVMKVVNV